MVAEETRERCIEQVLSDRQVIWHLQYLAAVFSYFAQPYGRSLPTAYSASGYRPENYEQACMFVRELLENTQPVDAAAIIRSNQGTPDKFNQLIRPIGIKKFIGDSVDLVNFSLLLEDKRLWIDVMHSLQVFLVTHDLFCCNWEKRYDLTKKIGPIQYANVSYRKTGKQRYESILVGEYPISQI